MNLNGRLVRLERQTGIGSDQTANGMAVEKLFADIAAAYEKLSPEGQEEAQRSIQQWIKEHRWGA